MHGIPERQHYLNLSVDELAVMPDAELAAIALGIAMDHYRVITSLSEIQVEEHVKKVHEFGVLVKGGKGATPGSLAARLMDKRWWRRQIFRRADERREHLAQISKELGEKTGQVCCSDKTLMIMHERLLATRKFMQSSFKIITSTVGTENPVYFSMAELDAKRKAARLSELFLDVKALEVIAKEQEWRWAFVTLTAPPQYHSNPAMGKNSYNEDLSPRLANKAIAADWKSIRGYLKERGYRPGESYFGVRVAEVHDDGCPHWHVLIFFNPSMFECLFDAVRQAYMGRGGYFDMNNEDIIRLGKKESEDGAAASSSYIFNYLAYALKVDEGVEPDMSVPNRYRCALRAMGARQFQMFGVRRTRGKLRALAQVNGKPNVPSKIKQMAESAFIQKTSGVESDELEAERRKKQLEARVSFFRGEAELLSYQHEYYINGYGEQVKRVLAIKHAGDSEGVQIGGLCEDIDSDELNRLLAKLPRAS